MMQNRKIFKNLSEIIESKKKRVGEMDFEQQKLFWVKDFT